MKYRAIRCQDCSKVEAFSLSSPEKCECGGINDCGWQVVESDYACFRIEKTVKELWTKQTKRGEIRWTFLKWHISK